MHSMQYAADDDVEDGPQSRTAFREAEKKYQLFRERKMKMKKGKLKAGKLVTRPIDMSDVMDLLGTTHPSGPPGVARHAVPGYDGPVFTFQRHPGLVYLPGALTRSQQLELTSAALTDFPDPPARTNHTVLYGPMPGLWRAAQAGLRLNWGRRDDPTAAGGGKRVPCAPAKPHRYPDPHQPAAATARAVATGTASPADPGLQNGVRTAAGPPAAAAAHPPGGAGSGSGHGAVTHSAPCAGQQPRPCPQPCPLQERVVTCRKDDVGSPGPCLRDAGAAASDGFPRENSVVAAAGDLAAGAEPQPLHRTSEEGDLGSGCTDPHGREDNGDGCGSCGGCGGCGDAAGRATAGHSAAREAVLRDPPGGLVQQRTLNAGSGCSDSDRESAGGSSHRSSGCGSGSDCCDGAAAEGAPPFEECWSAEGAGPPAEQLLRKLRWATLGPQFDWTARQYDFTGVYRQLPPSLEALAKQMAAVVNSLQAAGLQVLPAAASGAYKPDAAIINYYQPGDVLGGHLDDVERDMAQPIVSVSLGCPAIFLMGGPTKDTHPSAILLRGGDVLLLGGQARTCYHGVPRILEAAPGADPTPAAGQPAAVDDYTRCARINISIRAVA